MSKVREGYKMTELGEIPDEWEIKKLEEFSISSSYGPRFSAELYDENGNCRVIRGTDVVSSGKVSYEGIPYANISNEVLEKHKLIKNDFVVVTTADCGMSFVFNRDDTFMPSAYMVRIRFNDKLNPYYTNKFFETKIIKKQVESHIRKGTIANLPGSDLLRFKIFIPSILEQEKIASILSTVDEQIDNTVKLIQKNQELKKGLMQKLLTKGIGHTEYKKTEIGQIPKEWEVKELNELSEKIGDGLHGTPIYDENGEYYFVNGNNLESGKIVFSDESKMVNKDEYEKYKKELSQNTILISLNGTIGNLAFYNFEKVVLGKSSGYITLNNSISKEFIFYILNSERVKRYFIKELTGTTIKNLSLKTLRKTKVFLPSLIEQEKIASILSLIDEKIEQYQKNKEKLEEAKKGLMQQLLTGKIRVV